MCYFDFNFVRHPSHGKLLCTPEVPSMSAPSSHMNGGSHQLNLWWGPPFMWEERAHIYDTPRVPNNFPRHTHLTSFGSLLQTSSIWKHKLWRPAHAKFSPGLHHENGDAQSLGVNDYFIELVWNKWPTF